MYYELIRMITGHERGMCEESECYDIARSVGKIEGYQELTNKMQRVFNQRLNLEIDEISQRQIESDEKIESLAKKVNDIAEQNKHLSRNCSTLENANKALEFEVSMLKEKLENNQIEQRNFAELDLVFQELNIQNDLIEKLNEKVNKVTNNENTPTMNDSGNYSERICFLEAKETKFEDSLNNLEASDLYLQKSQQMLIERTNIVEKLSRDIERKINSLIMQKVDKDNGYVVHKRENYKMDMTEQNQPEKSIEEMEYRNKSESDGEMYTTKIDVTDYQQWHIHNNNENVNIDIYHELTEKYTKMLEKIEYMEMLLEGQTKNLTDYSDMFSEQYRKLLAKNIDEKENNQRHNIWKYTSSEIETNSFESSFQLEISNGNQLANDNIVREVSCLKAEVNNIKRHLQINCQSTSASCKRLEKIENNLFELFGKSGNHFSIYELIDFVVGINNSLNKVVEGFETSQSQFELFRDKQEEVLSSVAEQKQTLEYQSKRLDLVAERIEPTKVT